MSVMSHRHTVGFRKLREELATQKESTLNYGIELESARKDLEMKEKGFVEKVAALKEESS